MPQAPWDKLKSLRMWPAKTEIKKVCPNEDRNVSRMPAVRNGAFWRMKLRALKTSSPALQKDVCGGLHSQYGAGQQPCTARAISLKSALYFGEAPDQGQKRR